MVNCRRCWCQYYWCCSFANNFFVAIWVCTFVCVYLARADVVALYVPSIWSSGRKIRQWSRATESTNCCFHSWQNSKCKNNSLHRWRDWQRWFVDSIHPRTTAPTQHPISVVQKWFYEHFWLPINWLLHIFRVSRIFVAGCYLVTAKRWKTPERRICGRACVYCSTAYATKGTWAHVALQKCRQTHLIFVAGTAQKLAWNVYCLRWMDAGSALCTEASPDLKQFRSGFTICLVWFFVFLVFDAWWLGNYSAKMHQIKSTISNET